jgi:hypothetical protein
MLSVKTQYVGNTTRNYENAHEREFGNRAQKLENCSVSGPEWM